MKGFIQKIKDIWRHEELRRKIGYTLMLLLIYRVGSFIVLPGVDSTKLDAGSQGGLLGFLGLFTGGAFTRVSIFALGVMPYISASIIIQLLGLAVPAIQKMQREGESGRKKLNQWMRMLTIAIGLVQAPGYIAQYVPSNAHPAGSLWIVSAVIILTCSTLFVMWLGEKITDKGIGNGTSLIIMTGIISDIPRGFYSEFGAQTPFFFLIEMATLVVIIGATIGIIQAVRRIPLKVNSAGVMPIIFAQALMFLPATAMTYINGTGSAAGTSMFSDIYSFGYNLAFFILIVVFTYVYTALMINPGNYADYLKRSNAFIPGVKPGEATAEYIDSIMTRITLPGAVFLGLLGILPSLAASFGVNQQFALFFGGTTLLIMVGVALDTLQVIESYLLTSKYDGLIKSGRIQGRSSQGVQLGQPQ